MHTRLDTIQRVEEVIKKAEDALSKNEIDRRLKKKIMRPTLNLILDYLQKSNKIAILKNGIIWIWFEDSSPEFKKMVKQSIEVKPEFFRKHMK